MKNGIPNTPGRSSPEALFRYQVISKVLSMKLRGFSRRAAVQSVARQDHYVLDGTSRRISERTLYRWLAAFERAKETPELDILDFLEPASRKDARSSRVLPDSLLAYLVAEKEEDEAASIPELIRRARERGFIAPGENICRSTVYRVLRRRGIKVGRRRRVRDRDSRRYSYAHRMDCVLCDGKHFRAGVAQLKRVALFFLDDATRYLLHAVVGTSETTELFLRGLYEMVRRCGLMSVLYLDHGSAFTAADTVLVAKNLNAALVHGEKGYPEGRGKIERFNKTAKADVLRGLVGRPDVDPNCRALELRLQHYGREVYNHRSHESLERKSPYERFHSDEKELRFPDSDEVLRRSFTVSLRRRVSNDNVVSFNSVYYEMPRGYAGRKVVLERRLLDKTIHFLHQGRYIELASVDPVANAHSRRAKKQVKQKKTRSVPRKSAADLAFERRFHPVVDADGGFTGTGKEEEK